MIRGDKMNKDFDPYPFNIYEGDYEPDYCLEPAISKEDDEAFYKYLDSSKPSEERIKKHMEKLKAQGYEPPPCPEEIPF